MAGAAAVALAYWMLALELVWLLSLTTLRQPATPGAAASVSTRPGRPVRPPGTGSGRPV
jgi:hypothetical protein